MGEEGGRSFLSSMMFGQSGNLVPGVSRSTQGGPQIPADLSASEETFLLGAPGV